ncbi:MAG: TlpA family protein disulfide reductase [Gemmatimonas sp.]
MRARRGSTRSALLIAGMFLTGVALALVFEGRGRARSGAATVDSSDLSRPTPTATAALGISTVTNLDGQTVPLLNEGEPAIIMISSEVCAWCKQTFQDLRAMSAGRPMPRLRVITLEGAKEGQPMIDGAGLTGLQLLGPPDNSSAVSLTFRFQGTPTFFAVNKAGHVVRALLIPRERAMLSRLYKVMVGDADVP